MSIDMGGIRWPLRTPQQAMAATTAPLGSAKLDRQVAYQGNTLLVAATGTDGQPYSGPLDVVLTPRGGGDEVRPQVTGAEVRLAGVPLDKYRVTVNGVPAGMLAVL